MGRGTVTLPTFHPGEISVEEMVKKATSLIWKIIPFLYLVLILWVNVVNWLHGASGMFFSVLILTVFSLLLLVVFQFISIRWESLGDGVRRMITVILFGVYFALLLFCASRLWCDVYDTWDFGILIRSAYGIAFEGDIVDPSYYATYANNTFLLQLLTGVGRIARLLGVKDIYGFLKTAIAVNCVVICLSAVFFYLAADRAFGRGAGLLTQCMMMCSLPIYAYAAIPYTDTFGLLPLGVGLYLFACFLDAGSRKKRYFCAAGLALTLAIGYKIRPSLIIVMIAFVIVLVLQACGASWEMGKNTEAGKRGLTGPIAVFLAGSILVVLALNSSTNTFLDRYGVSSEMRQAQAFPFTHWIMMSLNPYNDGGFMDTDVALTASVEGKDAKNAQALSQIKERIRAMGIRKTLYHVFHTKVVHQWRFGSYSTGAYLGRHGLNETLLREFVANKGKYNRIYRMITQGFYCAILLLCLLTGINLKKCSPFSMALRLIFIGIFLFYLLWEVNARYLMVFHPVFVLLACESVNVWGQTIWKRRVLIGKCPPPDARKDERKAGIEYGNSER